MTHKIPSEFWLTICLAILLAALAPAATDPIVLVRDGRSTYSICISKEASPSERRGAEELQKFLYEMSGVRLPITDESAHPNGDLVFVGNSAALGQLKLNIPYSSLEPEGFVLKTSGRRLVIAGGRQRGTMYGVYTFLEKLGCRWFTREVSRIPKMRTIVVKPLDQTHRPAFEYREPFFTEAFDKDWAARNKMNGAHMELDESTGGKVRYFPFVHTFYQLLPPEKYFAEHPEYYSLIDGKRRSQRGQLCLSNPEVLRLSVAAVLRWMDEHSEATLYSVSQNDWEGWCECDRCRQVEKEEDGAHSGPILRFVNSIAAEVEKRHPDKLIDTLAYWYSEPPPSQARPRPNVRIRLCPINACEAHPYESCPYNAEFMKNLSGWSKITNQLYIWHYVTNFSHYLLPFPDFDELRADIPMYRRHGVVGLFLEGAYPKGGGGENSELRSYVMARLLWNPAANVHQEIEEFLAAYYGKAARPMRAYFDLLHRQVRMPPGGAGQHIWIRRSPELPEPVLRQARNLFRQAESAADNDTVRARVRKARLSIDYYELLHAKTFASRNGQYAPVGLDNFQSRLRSFLKDVRSFGITSIHEGVELSEDEREFSQSLKPYSVVTLENASLLVEVVPDLNGRVIRMIDRKTGLDALRPPDPGGHAPGLGLLVYPDFHSRAALEVKWKLAGSPGPRELALLGTGSDGLQLRRILRLAESDPVLHTQTILENNGPRTVAVTLQSRLDFNPGSKDSADISVAYRNQNGQEVRKTLLAAGVYSSGSESYTGAARPDGEWRLANHRTHLTLINRFAKEQVDRCTVNWRPRGENRIGIGVWSEEKLLPPGAILKLEVDYTLSKIR